MSFINKITKVENKQALLINEIIDSGKQVIIYGASVYAYVLHQYLAKRGVKIKCFAVDGAYLQQESYMGIDVIKIEDILPEISKFHIIVGIANYPSVLDKFSAKGIMDILTIDVPDFLNIPNSFMDLDFIKSNEQQFSKAYDFYEDQLSKETYVAAINTKINEDLSFIKPYVHPDHLYFTKTEFPISNDEILLDVGGFNGDSIRDFLKVCNGEYKKIISLEPFPETYVTLLQTIRELGISGKCKAIQIGAWHEKASLSFNNTEMGIDSKILSGANKTIEVDTIDSILENLNSEVSLIKMDINGSEYNALKGACETIKTNKPQIAVKMHVKEDFFRLPILLKEIDPSIKLYLRQRNYMSMMLVLYGVFK